MVYYQAESCVSTISHMLPFSSEPVCCKCVCVIPHYNSIVISDTIKSNWHQMWILNQHKRRGTVSKWAWSLGIY